MDNCHVSYCARNRLSAGLKPILTMSSLLKVIIGMPFARLAEEWQPPNGNAIQPVERMPFTWCFFKN